MQLRTHAQKLFEKVERTLPKSTHIIDYIRSKPVEWFFTLDSGCLFDHEHKATLDPTDMYELMPRKAALKASQRLARAGRKKRRRKNKTADQDAEKEKEKPHEETPDEEQRPRIRRKRGRPERSTSSRGSSPSARAKAGAKRRGRKKRDPQSDDTNHKDSNDKPAEEAKKENEKVEEEKKQEKKPDEDSDSSAENGHKSPDKIDSSHSSSSEEDSENSEKKKEAASDSDHKQKETPEEESGSASEKPLVPQKPHKESTRERARRLRREARECIEVGFLSSIRLVPSNLRDGIKSETSVVPNVSVPPKNEGEDLHQDQQQQERRGRRKLMDLPPPQATLLPAGSVNEFLKKLMGDLYYFGCRLEDDYTKRAEALAEEPDISEYWQALQGSAVTLQHIVNDIMLMHQQTELQNKQMAAMQHMLAQAQGMYRPLLYPMVPPAKPSAPNS